MERADGDRVSSGVRVGVCDGTGERAEGVAVGAVVAAASAGAEAPGVGAAAPGVGAAALGVGAASLGVGCAPHAMVTASRSARIRTPGA